MPGGRPARVALLAALYGVSGVFSLLNATWPMHPRSPVELGLAIGIVGILGAAWIWLRGARLTDREIHGVLTLAAVLVALLAEASMRPVGIVGLGPVIITICLYSGWFLPRTAARIQSLVTLTLASLGAIAAEPAGFLVPWVVLVFTAAVLTEIQGRLAEQLRLAATTDPLTGLINRRAWEAEAGRLLAHAGRSGEPLTVAILDLDDFKSVNDRHGHKAGDELLRAVTTRWSGELRRSDVLGRYGGDEFVLCLPGTDAEGTAEMLTRLVASHDFSWSAGTATREEGDSLADLLARADADLYRQKRGGRVA
jgi:diguanylate cyclase (GGDEF)-like protein